MNEPPSFSPVSKDEFCAETENVLSFRDVNETPSSARRHCRCCAGYSHYAILGKVQHYCIAPIRSESIAVLIVESLAGW